MQAKDTLFELAKVLEGVPVVGCLRGTPAALAGVRYGDILLSVNGCRTRNLADYIQAKALRANGMTAVVFRAGLEHPIELSYDPDRAAIEPLELIAELVSMRVLPVDISGSDPAS